MPNNNIAYIEKTMPKVLDKVLAKESLTESLIGNNEIKLDFLDAKTVKIPKMATTGLMPYNRGGHGSTNGTGAVQSTFEQFTLSQERFSAIPLDKLDTMDDGEIILGHMATEFIRTKVTPEFDAYRFSKLCGYTNVTLGNRVVESITNSSASGILAKFTAAFKWLTEMKVPEKDQVIYVNPEIMEDIQTSQELTRYLTQAEYKGDVDFTIQKFRGRPIVEVPSDIFFTEIDTSGESFKPKTGAKKINFMIVYKKAPIIVKKLDWTKVYDSDTVKLGYVGYEFDNLYYHDLFVTDNMAPCIYASVSTADAATAELNVDAVPGTTSNYTILKNALTRPAGIVWDKIGVSTSSTAPALGASFSTADVAQVSNGNITWKEFDAHSNSHTFLVASFDGKVVAVSKDFEDDLPKAA